MKIPFLLTTIVDTLRSPFPLHLTIQIDFENCVQAINAAAAVAACYSLSSSVIGVVSVLVWCEGNEMGGYVVCCTGSDVRERER